MLCNCFLMKMNSKIRLLKLLLFALIAGIIYNGCQKKEQFPPEPKIEYLSYLGTDTTDLNGNTIHNGLLTFGFTDGDGDIGLEEHQTEPPYDANMYIFQFGIHNGLSIFIDTLTFRIPYVTPEGQNKSLKGEIDIDLDIIYVLPPFDSIDTVKYELYILDRSLNQSNVITSEAISLL